MIIFRCDICNRDFTDKEALIDVDINARHYVREYGELNIERPYEKSLQICGSCLAKMIKVCENFIKGKE